MQSIVVPQVKSPSGNATVRRWLVEPGQPVAVDQVICELETEDTFVHLTASTPGCVAAVAAQAGMTLNVGSALGTFDEGASHQGAEPSSRQGDAALATSSAFRVPSSELPSGVTPILMPQVGNTMEEGTIIEWHAKPGDAIAVGQEICEIETDKATMMIEATDAGRLAKIVADSGDVIPVKEPIAFIADDDALLEGWLGGSIATATPSAPTPSPQSPAPAAELPASAVPILMPQVGNTMEEGTIIEWHAKPGDAITVGQEICEIETDKATMMIEATDAGRLSKIVADSGDVVAVKQAIAYLCDDDAAMEVFLASSHQANEASSHQGGSAVATSAIAHPTSAMAPAATTATGRIKASPAARKLAGERGLDLATIPTGSGPGGRILSSDLDQASPSHTQSAIRNPQSSAPAPAGATRTPMTKMRRAIGLNLQASKQTVPHFYLRREIDAAPMFAFYKANKPDTGCTINDVIVLAVGKAMAEFPAVRSQVDDRDIIEFAHANIGIAVGVEDGLVVPVVTDVDTMTLAELVPHTKRVVENARKGKLENIGKGNFTVSNLGMFKVDDFGAIINPPESGILAISGVREVPVVNDGEITIGKRMNLTLSCDHRIVDGLTAAEFMARVKELLEEPQTM